MDKQKEYTLGTLLTYVSIAVSSVGGIFLAPVMILYLGKAEYGLYQLLGSIIFYLGLFDFGLNATTVRYLSLYRAQKKPQKEARYLASVTTIYSIIGVIILITGYCGESYFDSLFASSLSPGELDEGKLIYRLSYITIALTMPGRVFEGICRANERFVFIQLMAIIRYLVRALLIVTLLFCFRQALTVVIIDMALNVIFFGISGWYSIRKIGCSFDFSRLRWSYSWQILSFSFWVFVACFATVMQWSFSQIVLGSGTNTGEVAIFSVAVMLGSYYGVFASSVNNIAVPKTMQIASIVKDPNAITDILIATARISLAIMLLVFSGFYLCGRQFIQLWLGEDFSPVWAMSLLIMGISTVRLSYIMANSVLEARKKVRIKAIISLLTTLCGAIACMLTVSDYGMKGVFICTLATMAANLVLMTICYTCFFGFQLGRFLKEAWARHLLITGLYTGGAHYLLSFIRPDTWGSFVSCLLCHTVILASLLFFFSCTGEERQYLYNSLKIR